MKLKIETRQLGFNAEQEDDLPGRTVIKSFSCDFDDVDENAPVGWLFYRICDMAQAHLNTTLRFSNTYLKTDTPTGEKDLSAATYQKQPLKNFCQNHERVYLFIYSPLENGIKCLSDTEEGANEKVSAMKNHYLLWELGKILDAANALCEVEISACDVSPLVYRKAEEIKQDLVRINRAKEGSVRGSLFLQKENSEISKSAENEPRGYCIYRGDNPAMRKHKDEMSEDKKESKMTMQLLKGLQEIVDKFKRLQGVKIVYKDVEPEVYNKVEEIKGRLSKFCQSQQSGLNIPKCVLFRPEEKKVVVAFMPDKCKL